MALALEKELSNFSNLCEGRIYENEMQATEERLYPRWGERRSTRCMNCFEDVFREILSETLLNGVGSEFIGQGLLG